MYPFVRALSELTKDTQIEADGKHSLLGTISACGSAITENPREFNEANQSILWATLNALFLRAEQLYGVGGDFKRLEYPIFEDHPNSLIAPLCKEADRFAVVIGKHFDTWETVFYEIAHESVHFLHPVANVNDHSVATLEEAVAVRFAENAYLQYVSSYTGLPPPHSPLGREQRSACPYVKGYKAIGNLTDPTLRALRKEFVSFSLAFDAERIIEICAGDIERSDAIVLAESFDYSYGRKIEK